MIKKLIFFFKTKTAFCILLVCIIITALVQCQNTAVSQSISEIPEELSFIFQALPDITIPSGVGMTSDIPAEDAAIYNTVLENAFKEAYLQALFQGLELTGIMGSDYANPWPRNEPLSWIQNWLITENSQDNMTNSWGIPNLVLALGRYYNPSGREINNTMIFTVSGIILDMYGRSAGYNRANGVVGYGYPLEDVYFFRGAAVQRFNRGRMIINREGSRFSFQADIMNSLLVNLNPEEKNRQFGGNNIPEEVTNAFAHSWAFIFSEQDGESDSPLIRVAFSRPWIIYAGLEQIIINGFYYKSYNRGNDILVLTDSPQLPRRAYYLGGSILQLILSRRRLPGILMERPLGSAAGSGGLGRSLAEGFAIYGPPLSNPLPRLNESEENSQALFQEAQRFARGWIINRTGSTYEDIQEEDDHEDVQEENDHEDMQEENDL